MRAPGRLHARSACRCRRPRRTARRSGCAPGRPRRAAPSELATRMRRRRVGVRRRSPGGWSRRARARRRRPRASSSTLRAFGDRLGQHRGLVRRRRVAPLERDDPRARRRRPAPPRPRRPRPRASPASREVGGVRVARWCRRARPGCRRRARGPDTQLLDLAVVEARGRRRAVLGEHLGEVTAVRAGAGVQGAFEDVGRSSHRVARVCRMPVRPGLVRRPSTMVVTDSDTALALGTGDVPVLATPRVVTLAEEATVHAVDGRARRRRRRPSATACSSTTSRPTAVGGQVHAEAIARDGRGPPPHVPRVGERRPRPRRRRPHHPGRRRARPLPREGRDVIPRRALHGRGERPEGRCRVSRHRASSAEVARARVGVGGVGEHVHDRQPVVREARGRARGRSRRAPRTSSPWPPSASATRS